MSVAQSLEAVLPPTSGRLGAPAARRNAPGATRPGTRELVLPLPADDSAPRLARDLVGEHADGMPTHVVEKALLLVSEVVGNAIRHGGPHIVLRLRLGVSGLRVDVTDDGQRFPVLAPDMPAPTHVGGRGMLIVDAVADAWGVTRHRSSPGKSVWFELRRTA